MAEFSTGKAARALRVSQSYLRALCQAGLIAARSTDGGHWRIPKAEVDRLRREGLPELPDPEPEPQAAPAADVQTSANGRPHPALLAEPSQEAVAAADQVVVLENQVKGLQLKRAKEENLDWFRERNVRRDRAIAAQEQRNLQTRAARLRQEWMAQWVTLALHSLPQDLPPAVELDVRQTVEEALADLGPDRPRYLVERIVHAAADKALLPFRRSKEVERTIEQAKEHLPATLPWGQRTEWESRAARAAAEAVNQLKADATLAEIRAVAVEAGLKVRAECERWQTQQEHREACERIAGGFFSGVPLDDQEEARGAVRQGLEKSPVGASDGALAKARDEALAPFRAKVKAAAEAERYLDHVGEYVHKLGDEESGEWDLGGLVERCELIDKLKAKLRPELIRELLRQPMDKGEAEEFIKCWIDDELGLGEDEESD